MVDSKFKAYKYTPSKFAAEIISNGSIRVGTLYQYKDEENPEIGDRREGYGVNSGLIPDGTFTGQSMPWIMRNAFTIGEGVEINIKNSVISAEGTYVHNAYIYCTTLHPNRIMMSRFNADSCVEITDAVQFAVAIAEKLYLEGLTLDPFPLIKKCVYNDRYLRAQSDEETDIIYWLKDSFYAAQMELRFIFFAKNPYDITPINIRVPKVTGCVKLHQFAD